MPAHSRKLRATRTAYAVRLADGRTVAGFLYPPLGSPPPARLDTYEIAPQCYAVLADLDDPSGPPKKAHLWSTEVGAAGVAAKIPGAEVVPVEQVAS